MGGSKGDNVDIAIPDLLTSAPVLAGLGALVLVLIAALVFFLVRRRASGTGTRASRTPHVDEADLHQVERGLAVQLHRRWQDLQRDFVDAPADTLQRAEALVAEAMRARGYPATDADGRLELLEDHEPAHVERYRRLRGLQDTDASTEDRRQAFLQARVLFDALLRDGVAGQPRLFAAS